MSDFCHPMTRQKSRKVHQCVCCYHAIEKGAYYCKQTGVLDGNYFTNRFHPECWMALLEEGDDFEVMPGEGDPPEGARTMKAAAASMSPDLAAAGREGVR